MSSVLLGILNAQAAGAAESAFDLLHTEVVGGQVAYYDFDVSSYASTYRHLHIRIMGVGTQGATLRIRYNGDAGSNYSVQQFFADSGTTSTNGVGSIDYIYAGNFSAFDQKWPDIIDIYDAFSSSKYKSTMSMSSNGTMFLRQGMWKNTNPITSVRLDPDGNWAANTRMSLYGVK